MPTYEYLCEDCGHRFDHFQSMSSPRLSICPVEDCGGPLKRLIGTGAGIVFKGSGFYETDYKRKPTPTGSSDKPASAGSAEKSTPTGDSKPKGPATPVATE